MAASAADRIVHERRERPANQTIPAVWCKDFENTVQLGGSARFFDVFNPLIAYSEIGFWGHWTSWAAVNGRSTLSGEPPRRVHHSVCLSPHRTNDCEWELHASLTETLGIVPAKNVADLRFSCPDESVLVSGSCVRTLQFPTQSFDETTIARHGFTDPFREWSCVVSNLIDVDIEVKLVAVCLTPFIQNRCGACSAEGDLFELVEESQPLEVGTNLVQATCPKDTRLILGNCMIDAPIHEMSHLTMFGTGYTGDQVPGDTWECGWNNRDGIFGTATTYALCLR
ncbi:MAG: hypothetical protein MJE77_16165 [Proteobacteria bacterium]|nr:hypothetical protein [Pseudomonadota bacterium]